MSQTKQVVFDAILHRRTTKVAKMNGQKIEDGTIQALLKLADAAPTHARTEPWRFNIYSGAALQAFCENHGNMYWENADTEKRSEGTKNNLSNMYQNASHLIVAMMRRTPEAKIPWLEEYAASAAAVQNILIGAEAAGIGAFWNTGGMVLKPAMKDYLGLGAEDEVLGFLYMGYADDIEAQLPMRNIPLEDKVNFYN